MLDVIRKKKEHWVSAFIVLIVAGVMAFFGVSKFSDDSNSPNKPVAWVNGEAIGRRDFTRELEFTLNQYRNVLGAKYDENLIKAFRVPQRTLERMVQYRLLTQQADKMGFFISDKELSDHIRALPYFQKDGKFDASLYAQIPNPGLEERRQRESMGATRLQNYMTSRIKLLPLDLSPSMILKNTQVELQFAAIDFNQLAPKDKPSSQVVDEISKNESLIKTRYESRIKDFTEAARYHFRQIRVGVPFQATPEVKQKARTKIDSIQSKLSPETFETVAKTQSDDEYAKTNGDRGWVKETELEQPFIDALSALTPKQISKVIDTPSGFYLLQLTEKTPSQVKPLETVRVTLINQLAEEKIKADFIDGLRKQWENALTEGKSIEPELLKYKIQLKKTGKFSLDKNNIPEIGNADSILEALYELSPKQPSPKKFYFYQDKYYYLKLLSISPSKENAPKKEDEDAFSNALQADLFKSWIESLEKQASIKMDKEFETKPENPTTSL